MFEKKINRHTTGLRLLECILEEESWDLLTDNDLHDSDFYGDAAEVLKYVRKYFNDYNEFPPKDFVIENVDLFGKKVQFPKKINSVEAIESFKRYKMAKKVTSINQKSQELVLAGDPWKAITYLQTRVNTLETVTKIQPFVEGGNTRYDEYKQRKLTGLKGIQPYWPSLQKSFIVYENGTFNAILGISGANKTWCMCVQSMYAAFTLNKKVLLVTLENSSNSINSRLDSLYNKIAFGDIRTGFVDFRVEKQWKRNLADKLPNERGDIIVADASRVKTVEDIQQLVILLKPDFVVIDGAYKLTTLQGSSGYDRSNLVLGALHQGAIDSNIPWLASSQLNKGAMDAAGGRAVAFEARFNKEWLMDPSTVMCLVPTDGDLLLNRVKCIISKIRDVGDVSGLDMEFYINSNRVTMDFSEQVEDYFNEEIMAMTL